MLAQLEDRTFAQAIDDARNRYRLSDIIGRVSRLRPAGREMVGLCIVHPERSPSMRVNDASGLFHCFGCGTSGDAITAVQHIEGVGFADALRWLLGQQDLPAVSDADRLRALEEDQQARRAAILDAKEQWASCASIVGTPGENYLRGRGITIPLPSSLRFGYVSPWRDRETGKWVHARPAVVGCCGNMGGRLTAVQRIFVRPDGSGKANMRRPKLTLGRNLGSALRLTPPAAEVIITEGVEDGLSILQECPDSAVWCGLGTAFLREIQFPPVVRSVVVAGQNDDAGKSAAVAASEAIAARGLHVKTTFPSARYKDWNDELRNIPA